MRFRRHDQTFNEILLDGVEHERDPGAAEPEQHVRVEASRFAGRLIRDRGGRVYIWTEGIGVRAAMRRPDGDVTFVCFETDRFELYQDETIRTPRFWKLERRLFPPGIVALWNGGD